MNKTHLVLGRARSGTTWLANKRAVAGRARAEKKARSRLADELRDGRNANNELRWEMIEATRDVEFLESLKKAGKHIETELRAARQKI